MKNTKAINIKDYPLVSASIGLFIILASLFLIPNSALAFSSQQITETNPAILPGNPFYFIKSWTQGVQDMFINNPVKKLMFNSYLLDQKGAEIAIAMEFDGPVSKATVEDYALRANSFSTKIKELTTQQITNNLGLVFENSDQLIDYLLERAIIHSELHLEIFNQNGENQALTSSELALREAINKLGILDTNPSLSERIQLISQAQNSDFALRFLP